LLVVIITFIVLKLQVLGNENSGFNRTTRYRLGKYDWARTVLGMHSDGDAQARYLDGSGPIALIVVKPDNISLDGKVLGEFAARISAITGRPVSLFNQESIQNGILSDMDMDKIVEATRRAYLPGSQDVFVMYAEDFEGEDNEVGRTYKEYGMVLSDRKLKSITENATQAMDDYVLSTMLHEFGHQIGLDHNNGKDCIMNEEVESPRKAYEFSGKYTPTDFCQQELDEIRQLKVKYQ